jgi:hypothetical protein
MVFAKCAPFYLNLVHGSCPRASPQDCGDRSEGIKGLSGPKIFHLKHDTTFHLKHEFYLIAQIPFLNRAIKKMNYYELRKTEWKKPKGGRECGRIKETRGRESKQAGRDKGERDRETER